MDSERDRSLNDLPVLSPNLRWQHRPRDLDIPPAPISRELIRRHRRPEVSVQQHHPTTRAFGQRIERQERSTVAPALEPDRQKSNGRDPRQQLEASEPVPACYRPSVTGSMPVTHAMSVASI